MQFRTSTITQTSLYLLLFSVLFLTGCDVLKKKEVVVPTEFKEPSAKNIHVAFAGGGWRAHTGHAGWIISLLDNKTYDLNTAFADVGTIGSNSGGSWFNTMLTFSDTFVSEVQANNAIENWKKTGWLGKQHTLFKNTKGCDHFWDTSYLYTRCVLNTNDNNSGNWVDIVHDIIFDGYSLGNKTLSSTRETWAKDKALLLAGSMLTSNVLINADGKEFDGGKGDYQFYQACLNPATPKVRDFRFAASCENTSSPFHEVTPVTFTGLPAGSKDKIPPFLSILQSDDFFNVEYSEVKSFDLETKSIKIFNPAVNDNLSAVHAASASSAALGFFAFVRPDDEVWWWGDAYGFRNFAPSFSLNESVQYVETKGVPVDQLADQKIVRIADGGAVDNSGVAQIVKYAQLNNPKKSFNIVAFDNVTSALDQTPDGFPFQAKVGPDIANLFGLGLCGDEQNKFCFVGCSDIEQFAGCVDVPDLQIFNQEPLILTPKKWDFELNGMMMVYTQYEVTTVDNPNFGIGAGMQGVLHSFTCVAPNAGTVPTTSDFSAYNNMLDFINNGLNDLSGGEGLRHLKKAFNLN